MFKASKNILTNYIHILFIIGKLYKFIMNKIRTDRQSFCITIIGNCYLNPFKIKKYINIFKNYVKKMILNVTNLL